MQTNPTVAIAQSASFHLHIEKGMQKAEELIIKAAKKGADLLVFAETWLGGYPAWLDHLPNVARWDHKATKQVFGRLRRNSIYVPGEETQTLSSLAKKHSIVIGIGINERVKTGPGNGTLYNSFLLFDADGSLLLHHRKLVPTYTERLIWGPGDAKGLRSVQTAAGKVSALICWEHWMPLARQALHEDGEQIHIALWPTVNEIHQLASRHYAFEGRCFVLAAGALMPCSDIPEEFEATLDNIPDNLLLRGGSCIIGPDGKFLLEPVFAKEEILLQQLDLHRIDEEKMTLDVTGHYTRPDIFSFSVSRETNRISTNKLPPTQEDLAKTPESSPE